MTSRANKKSRLSSNFFLKWADVYVYISAAGAPTLEVVNIGWYSMTLVVEDAGCIPESGMTYSYIIYICDGSFSDVCNLNFTGNTRKTSNLTLYLNSEKQRCQTLPKIL